MHSGCSWRYSSRVSGHLLRLLSCNCAALAKVCAYANLIHGAPTPVRRRLRNFNLDGQTITTPDTRTDTHTPTVTYIWPNSHSNNRRQTTLENVPHLLLAPLSLLNLPAFFVCVCKLPLCQLVHSHSSSLSLAFSCFASVFRFSF